MFIFMSMHVEASNSQLLYIVAPMREVFRHISSMVTFTSLFTHLFSSHCEKTLFRCEELINNVRIVSSSVTVVT